MVTLDYVTYFDQDFRLLWSGKFDGSPYDSPFANYGIILMQHKQDGKRALRIVRKAHYAMLRESRPTPWKKPRVIR